MFVYTPQNITQPSRKNEILSFAERWMELEITMLSELSQVQSQTMHILAHLWKLDLKS
jgi:hypothetical protein